MSVPNQTPYIIYNANGLTTVFPFEFYIINANDIQVTINGTLVSSGYSVSGAGNVGGGNVIFITPPANGSVVMLERVVPTYRLTDYQDNGDLLADTVNKDFDRLWMAIQRSSIYLGLALRRPLFGGPFNAEGYRIEKLADPVNEQDAATKKYVETVSLARTLRVPENTVQPAPPVSARANHLLAFNSEGNPIAVLPASGSASEVLIDLASSEDGKGDALIAVKQPFTGSVVRTQHDKNKDVINVKDFGAKGDGVSDDTMPIQAAIDAATIYGGKITFPQGVIRINGTVRIKSNVDIDLSGCTILATGNASGFYAENESNFSLRNGRIYKTINYPDNPPTDVVSNNFGVGINGCSRFNLDKLDVRGFGDCGIVITSSEAGTNGEVVSYSNISFCNVSYNYTGIKIIGSFASEYIHLVGCNAFKNNAAGIHNEAGNVTLSACTAASNMVVGYYLKSGANAGHGSASSCNFNHNTGKNILVDSLTQGYMFAGCNIFDDNGADPFSGMIQLAGCAGVVFSGCQIMANIQIDGLNRINQMVGCSFYGDREYLISSGDNSNGYLVFTNCTQGGGGFKANIPGVNATYGFISADYQSTANPSVVKFNTIGVHSGVPLLDKETGVCVAQSTGLHCISFKITASTPFSVTLVANGSPHSKSIAGQIGSIYACSLTSYVYLQKGQQFNVAIECPVGTTIQQQSTIFAYV